MNHVNSNYSPQKTTLPEKSTQTSNIILNNPRQNIKSKPEKSKLSASKKRLKNISRQNFHKLSTPLTQNMLRSSKFDPFGSYTGSPANKTDRPTQDADDL